ALALAEPGAVASLDFGDALKISGFPLSGSDTVTFAPSTIIGFWNDPDLKKIGGADKINASRVNLIKTNGISGPGGSGSPVLDKDDKVVAMMFAGQQSSAVPGLSITVDSFRNWEDRATAAGATAGCLFDPAFDAYVSSGAGDASGKKFYDPACKIGVDKGIESVVSQNFQEHCLSVDLPPSLLKKATRHVIESSSIDKWVVYLKKVCPAGAQVATRKDDTSMAVLAGMKSPAKKPAVKAVKKPGVKVTVKSATKPATKSVVKPAQKSQTK
ncbi:MAG: hypothetical protein AAB316_12650, partial [Bacteroidota bacterium]